MKLNTLLWLLVLTGSGDCGLMMADPAGQSGSAVFGEPRVSVREVSLIQMRGANSSAPNQAGDTDCNSPAHWDAGTLYLFNSAGHPWRSAGPDLSHLDQEYRRCEYDNPANGGRWIECTWKAADGVLYSWYHQEPTGLFPGTGLTAPFIGAARSTNNGVTWHDMGRVLEARSNSLHAGTTNFYFAGGHGDFSSILDGKKEYLYLFFSTYAGEASEQGVAMARMRWSDRDEPGGKVRKWYQGQWKEPGLGGKVTPFLPVKADWHGAGVDAFWGPSIHWNWYLGQYVILLNRAVDRQWKQEGIYISYNSEVSDPTGWTAPRKILETPGNDRWYPQVIGLDAARHETDKLAGPVARLFVRGQSRWEIRFEAASDWPTVSPESQGFDAGKLEGLWTGLTNRGTHGLLVIRRDQVVFERYLAGYGRSKPHGTASLAKALVGGASLMLAMDEGRVNPDDPASRFVPSWAGDPIKSKITIRQLATHTSGIEDAEADDLSHEKLSGWKGDFWKREAPPRDPFTLARDTAPVLDPPGTRARYSNPGMGMLAYCVTASLRGGTNADLRSLLETRLMKPLGIPAGEWSIGYGKPVSIEGMDLFANWGGASFSPNAAARIGRLMIRHGNWDGRQLVSERVVREMTTHAGLPNSSGLCWWVNRQADGSRVWPAAPADAFWGAGAGHQLLFVVPSLELILVRNGSVLDPKVDFNDGLGKHLVTPLMQAMSDRGTPAPPASPVIKEIRWAPKETIQHSAQGSDNWPITWADDDALYTAYGDGNGFEPFVKEKLSLGFTKVTGEPPNFRGENIRSANGEQVGNGKQGRKASGLLGVDRVLYLWARNAGNARLAWSADHGVTWSWADWTFTWSFGCPTFLNFGKNYAGSSDGFVYVYSPDSDSAYEAADRIVLARAPKDRIRERPAYEFFVRVNAGQPVWTKDVAGRGAMLDWPGHCYRSTVSYCAGLQRYLLVQPVPAAASRDAQGKLDTRFRGGLAILDAPAPWGPWTTAFLSDDWDVGPGDSASFPTKWMSSDGRTLDLVFSGNDSFSVRRATILVREREGDVNQ